MGCETVGRDRAEGEHQRLEHKQMAGVATGRIDRREQEEHRFKMKRKE